MADRLTVIDIEDYSTRFHPAIVRRPHQWLKGLSCAELVRLKADDNRSLNSATNGLTASRNFD
jgi:hypothetical protein